MIHELSNKDISSMDMMNDDMMQAEENDIVQAMDNDASYEMSNGGDRAEKEVFEEVKCMSNDNKNSGDASNESHNENHNCNVSKPVNVDNAVPDNDVVIDVCVSKKLLDNDVKEIDNLKKGSYVSARNKNVLESDNKLFSVPTSVNKKKDDVVILDEDLVNRGSEKWKFTVCGYFFGSSMHDYEVKYNLRRIREAWSIKGISTVSSRLGRPIMMDEMTSNMCNRGTRRLRYARVLVEIEANKGQEQKRRRRKLTLVLIKKVIKMDIQKPKVPTAHMDKGNQVRSDNQKGSGNDMRTSSRLEKVWNIGKSNVEELNRSVNKYVVLPEVNEENSSKTIDEIMIDSRLIMDEFVKKKLQPSIYDTKDWSHDMINYFKYAWVAMERRMNVESDAENVMENVEDIV
uniref:ATPase, F1/V1/A1 complex, alpha/beta subunit, zinc knuckle CX2CX4HX4C n=1 Tax=Tanacetum cinerariifolium TaxID=118510 RepID=A0A699GXR2_TANCI|nr:ATPase, F1/V1/A1 complex, alpha/beta subunit, zinc knuckle CX2CX4HX4C [Tanacetum cinerariifolium]